LSLYGQPYQPSFVHNAAPDFHPAQMKAIALASRRMSDDDHNLDDLKERLYRSFGVDVRPDLQVRAEIVIQPEEGRWVFSPDELRDLAHGLESILLNSSPGAGWPFRLTLKQYIGLFSPLFTYMGDEKQNASAS